MGQTPIPIVMGHNPPAPYIPYQQHSEAWLREQLRGRFSRREEKRKAAHRACLELLRRYEVALGEREEDDLTPKPPPKPARPLAPERWPA